MYLFIGERASERDIVSGVQIRLVQYIYITYYIDTEKYRESVTVH